MSKVEIQFPVDKYEAEVTILKEDDTYAWMWRSKRPGTLSKAGRRGFASPEAALESAAAWVRERFGEEVR